MNRLMCGRHRHDVVTGSQKNQSVVIFWCHPCQVSRQERLCVRDGGWSFLCHNSLRGEWCSVFAAEPEYKCLIGQFTKFYMAVRTFWYFSQSCYSSVDVAYVTIAVQKWHVGRRACCECSVWRQACFVAQIEPTAVACTRDANTRRRFRRHGRRSQGSHAIRFDPSKSAC